MSEENNEAPVIKINTVETETTDSTTETEAETAAAPQETASTESSIPVPDAKEVENGKAFAVLSYVLGFIGIPFFLVPLIMRDNDFSLYHAKQCMMIWIAGLAGGMISSLLIPVFCLGIITGIALGIFIIVITIMGLINATKGIMVPLPLIGKYSDEWFKGISKVQQSK